MLVLQDIDKRDVEQILCLGDLNNPAIARMLAEFRVPTFMVWGNNDGEKTIITKVSLAEGSNLSVADTAYAFFEAVGKKIFMTHYPHIAKPMAKSGDFDLVAYGHNHEKNLDKIDNCIVVNPGEISGHKTGISSYAIYDTNSNEVEIVILDKAMILKTPEVDSYLEKIGFKFNQHKHHKY